MTQDFPYPEEVKKAHSEKVLSVLYRNNMEKIVQDIQAITRAIVEARSQMEKLNMELEISARILAETIEAITFLLQ
jgi:hypothetical protein